MSNLLENRSLIYDMGTNEKNASDKTQAPNPEYESFVRLLVQHEPIMRAYLRGLLPSWQDAQDVAQEASLIAWRKFDSFTEGTSFRGWLLTIARFEALKRRRQLARTPLIFSDELWNILADESQDYDKTEHLHNHLEKCLKRLDPKTRQLVVQCHAREVSIKEIAAFSHKSESAFYKWIQRIRIKLMDCVNQFQVEEAS